MTQQIINVGTAANDGTGDPLRTAMQKANANFSEIYARDAVGSNLDLSNNELSATNTNGNVQIAPNGAGNVIIVDDTLIISSSKTPATATGTAGDKLGMIAWDASNIFVCIANYDGSTHIWRKATLSTW